MNPPDLDPRTLPLSGLQLIEASAGTGKTFNLAGLYLRLVVERGASVREILVMTFTKAATQELRERIRRRLVDAARIARDPSAAIADHPEHDFARDIIAGAIDATDEPRERIARRLTEAAAGVDEATIVTIHGFAQRAAADNAFDSAQAFDRGEIVDDRSVQSEAAADLWRQSIVGATGDASLLDVWPTPDALHKDIAPILSRPNITVDGADENAFAAALKTLWTVWQEDKAALETAIAEALEASAFKKSGMQTLLANYEDAADFVSTIDTRLAQAVETGQPPVLPKALAELVDPWQFIAKSSNAKKACATAFEALTLGEPLADLVTRAHVVRSARAADAVAALAARRKIEWRQFSYDDLVLALRDALVDESRGPRLAAALRAQWPYALVDEFQDTDPLQYDSLKRIYLADDAPNDNTALLLIGDPKQAIYAFRGGDIHAYLAAARAAGNAQYTLGTNYRSSPAVLEAIAALFQTPKDTPFLEAGIGFRAVGAGRAPGDRRLVHRGHTDGDNSDKTQPALSVWQFTGGSGTKGDDETAMVHRTVSAVAGMLAGDAAWQSEDPAWNRAVEPRDIAILVNSNFQAATLQIALAEHGIAAVCQRRDSIFATEEAHDLALLLTALARPDDVRAVKSAETTRLAGARLADLIALTEDDTALQTRVARYQAHHQRWAERGVLAALEAAFVAAGPNILALTDGERRMSNYLQIGELLAEAQAECYGMDGLVHWLDRAIADAKDADGRAESGEEAQLRLESDDALVRIATVHSSKGLEYPIVFLPFAAFLGAPTGMKDPTKPPHVYHDADSDTPERVRIDLSGTSEKAQARAVTEFHAESLRLLYVALTRAADALFITWREPGDGASNQAGRGAQNTALDKLLGRDASVSHTLAALAKKHPNVMSIERIDTDAPRRAIPMVAGDTNRNLTGGREDLPAPRTPWSSWSFSRLAHAPAGASSAASTPVPGAEDEWAAPTPTIELGTDAGNDTGSKEQPLPALDRALAGVGFGSAIHDLLEHAVFHGWPAPDATADEKTRKRTADTLRRWGLTGDDREETNRIDQSIALVARTLHAPLPVIGPLADVAPNRMLAEIGFLLGMGDQRLATIVDAARAAGYLQAPLARSATLSLNGLLQGFIDLVVEVEGAYWILDYKTNRLGDTPGAYGADALAGAISASHYDLQYLLYTVALHRHLRSCLDDYDPDRHLGGVQYLFVRAMDGQSTRGVFVDRPDVALIETLDALFDGQAVDRGATA
ncbi:exodeoxyribonuclease V subunit beta [Salinisphaera aquimarina]|uniref:RecBCD enzyme subunit RecB n=1 Tax=Salinisphaera aquimarina TaxID=2094031 RepID=A0ABV7EPF4_9GAMM